MTEPTVIDLNTMSDEQLALVTEAARRELADRQTRHTIARELEDCADRISADNPRLMGEGWTAGRVTVTTDQIVIGRGSD